MLIDCDSCSGRGAACAGCMMRALVEGPPGSVQRPGPEPGPEPAAELTGAELRAAEVFARAGFDVEVLAQTALQRRRSGRRGQRRHVA